MKILICGDRNWVSYKEYDILVDRLNQIHEQTEISCVIEGEARGADSFGRLWAQSKGIPVMAFPANWDYYKKAAGPIRNGWMLKFGQPDLVVAFHRNIENSKGTKNMVEQARKQKIEVQIYSG